MKQLARTQIFDFICEVFYNWQDSEHLRLEIENSTDLTVMKLIEKIIERKLKFKEMKYVTEFTFV